MLLSNSTDENPGSPWSYLDLSLSIPVIILTKRGNTRLEKSRRLFTKLTIQQLSNKKG